MRVATRPLYETESDRRAEMEIAQEIEARLHIRLHKLPNSYWLDFFATLDGGGPVAWVEVKDRRGFRWGQYPTVMVSVLKVQNASRLIDATGLPALFVVRDVEGDTRCVDFGAMLKRSDLIRWGGRTHWTRDASDIEPVMHVPIEWFKTLDQVMIANLVVQ